MYFFANATFIRNIKQQIFFFCSRRSFLIKIDTMEISNVQNILYHKYFSLSNCELQYVPISRVCFALDNDAKLLKKPSAVDYLHPRVIIMYPGDTETSRCKQKRDRRMLTQVDKSKKTAFLKQSSI